MTEIAPVDVGLPNDRPPDWANSMMRWALGTPGIQGMVGQAVALLSFRGRKTGTPYTIPVSYDREGDTVTVVTKRLRKWWHNFETPIEVELRLAGHMFFGKAVADTDEKAVLDYLTGYLQRRPIDAKAYGLAKDELTREKVARIVPHVVMIRIQVTPSE